MVGLTRFDASPEEPGRQDDAAPPGTDVCPQGPDRCGHRCELAVAGADLPAGDAFVVSNLLEELGDDDAATLLGCCRTALRPHGRVLVIGPLVHDRARRRFGFAALVDLEMLLFTPSGTVRSEEALRALCTCAGLTPKSFVPAQGDFVLEAVASTRLLRTADA
jgi:O-methyltransferase domain